MPGLGGPRQKPPSIQPADWSTPWAFPPPRRPDHDVRLPQAARHDRPLLPGELLVYSHVPELPSDQVQTLLDRRREMILLRMLTARYKQEQSPLVAWRALLASRAIGTPIPEWVARYLERCAQRMWAYFERGTWPSGAEIQACLALKPPGRSGRGTELGHYNDLRALRCAIEVHLVQAPTSPNSKRSHTERVRRAAEAMQVDPSIVWAAIKKYPSKESLGPLMSR